MRSNGSVAARKATWRRQGHFRLLCSVAMLSPVGKDGGDDNLGSRSNRAGGRETPASETGHVPQR